MSLYDTIFTIPGNPIVCPNCKYGITSFQTKALDPRLENYKEGTKVLEIPQYRVTTKEERTFKIGRLNLPMLKPTGESVYVDHPKYKAFYAYCTCPQCRQWVEQNFRFEVDGTLVRIGDPISEV